MRLIIFKACQTLPALHKASLHTPRKWIMCQRKQSVSKLSDSLGMTTNKDHIEQWHQRWEEAQEAVLRQLLSVYAATLFNNRRHNDRRRRHHSYRNPRLDKIQRECVLISLFAFYVYVTHVLRVAAAWPLPIAWLPDLGILEDQHLSRREVRAEQGDWLMGIDCEQGITIQENQITSNESVVLVIHSHQ